MKKLTLILILLSSISTQSIFAQVEAKKESDYPNPKKAVIYSAILPGAGQFYNKKYWKIPIIYGLGGFLVYNYSRFNKEYNCYRNSLNDQSLESFCSDYGIDNLDDSQIRDRKDIVKRNRDLQLVLLFLTYVVNIVDANVDAHLKEFDIGEKSSASITPALTPYQINGRNSNALGLNINLNF